MKPLFVLILFFACKTVSAQVSPGELRLLEKLDSVQNSEPPANHFAGLYITATSNAILFWQTRSEQERNLNRRFETRFASFFSQLLILIQTAGIFRKSGRIISGITIFHNCNTNYWVLMHT